MCQNILTLLFFACYSSHLYVHFKMHSPSVEKPNFGDNFLFHPSALGLSKMHTLLVPLSNIICRVQHLINLSLPKPCQPPPQSLVVNPPIPCVTHLVWKNSQQCQLNQTLTPPPTNPPPFHVQREIARKLRQKELLRLPLLPHPHCLLFQKGVGRVKMAKKQLYGEGGSPQCSHPFTPTWRGLL